MKTRITKSQNRQLCMKCNGADIETHGLYCPDNKPQPTPGPRDHTPTPWEYLGRASFNGRRIGVIGTHVAVVSGLSNVEENMAFILSAVNNYTRQREIIGELQTAIEKMRAMLPKEATATESLMFQSGLLEALARSRKAIGESK